MKFSQNKNSSKKVGAFYLAVAFFFTVFSFGKLPVAEAFNGPYLPSTYNSGTDQWTVDNCSSILQGIAFSYTKYRNGANSGSANTGGNCAAFQPLPLSFYASEYASAGSPGYPFEVALEFYDSTGGSGTPLGHTIVNYNGTTVTPVPPIPTASSVEIDTPTNATDYPSNPIFFSGTYTNVHTFNQIQFELANTSFSGSLFIPPINLPFITAIEQPWSFSKNLGFQGEYEFRARLVDTNNGSTTPWTSTITFGLGTTTISTTTQETLPGAPLPIDCDALDIACHIKNAMVWLFYPENSIERFQDIYADAQTRAPFVYVDQVLGLREEIFNATPATTTIALHVKFIPGQGTSTITMLSKEMLEAVPFSGLINTILEAILYFMAVEYIYYRAIKMHDNNTPK